MQYSVMRVQNTTQGQSKDWPSMIVVCLFLSTGYVLDVDKNRTAAFSPEFVWVEVEELLSTLSYSY